MANKEPSLLARIITFGFLLACYGLFALVAVAAFELHRYGTFGLATIIAAVLAMMMYAVIQYKSTS